MRYYDKLSQDEINDDMVKSMRLFFALAMLSKYALNYADPNSEVAYLV